MSISSPLPIFISFLEINSLIDKSCVKLVHIAAYTSSTSLAKSQDILTRFYVSLVIKILRCRKSSVGRCLLILLIDTREGVRWSGYTAVFRLLRERDRPHFMWAHVRYRQCSYRERNYLQYYGKTLNYISLTPHVVCFYLTFTFWTCLSSLAVSLNQQCPKPLVFKRIPRIRISQISGHPV
jgi:hypothetical protein